MASDTEEFNFDDIDALLSDLDIIDKQHKVMLDNSGSHSANCGNDNDEVMEVVETSQLILSYWSVRPKGKKIHFSIFLMKKQMLHQ